MAQTLESLARMPFLIAVAITASLVYAVIVVIYRLTFHPLAKYPGPFLARITDWYSVYHAWKGDRHIEFYRIHQKYGKFVRFGPNRLSVNSNTALKTIYGANANVQKSTFYNVFTHFFKTSSTQTLVDKVKHGRKRRVLSYALSDRALKAMEEAVLQNVRTFCGYLRADKNTKDVNSVSSTAHHTGGGWAPAKNMANWAGYLSFDTMGDICFGRSYGMMNGDENRYIIDVLADGAQGLNIVGHMPGLLKIHLDKLLFRKLVQGTQRYEAYSKAQSDARVRQDPQIECRDVFQFLLEAKDPETGQAFSMPELVSESSLLIIAGSDTTSTALAATLFYLLHTPNALETLKSEVRSTFNEVEEIRSGAALSSCRFLRACIDEAMRLAPPVGGLMPREVLPGGIDIDGDHVPGGIDVGTPIYALHHNEQYFPAPFNFRPSRWIANREDQLSADSVTLAQSAFCPFSVGPRGCVGRSMAYMEMTISLARMVWLYDMRLGEMYALGEGNSNLEAGRRREEEFQMIDKFVSKVDGPMVQFRAR
ncbi:MAG: hypothetical protein M1837_007371 [Sclerophora amabilis]|nr:MAG: hypothetical protein M1837_007371 [Sclerophora amabilis]